MLSVLWLGLNLPPRRLWLREQNREEVASDIGDVSTTSFQDISVVVGLNDFPLKGLASATINYSTQTEKKNLDWFSVLGQEHNLLGKEALILFMSAPDKCALDRLAFNDVVIGY